MNDWLSGTWEANWRSFQYFNLYRLVVALLFWLTILFPHEWTDRLNLLPSPLVLGLATTYMLLVLTGLMFAIHWQHRFNAQLTLQVGIDVLFVAVLLHYSGGVRSGVSILLLVSLAAASLVGRGRLVLFYAALATLAVLLVQLVGIVRGVFEESSVLQAGLISAGFFATAILARLLGQRAMLNEELARRRGEALENQMRIARQIEERMQDGVLVMTLQGELLRSNPVARALLGEEGATHTLLAELGEALARWRSGNAFSLQQIGDSALNVRFAPTSSSDGEILAFLQDTRRIREQAQQLKLASLGRLTASIAHEIRNPLAAISHAGELLREERRGGVHDRLLRILHDNVIRLDGIVKDVLELGRQDRALPEQIHLAEFCPAFIEELVRTEGCASELVAIDLPDRFAICFDRTHLYRVLWNLLGNAIRYSRQGVASVRLIGSPGPVDGRVELHVIDDGVGVADAVREQIFEPFFTTHHQGTGLGLYIARELCQANGTELELLSSEQGAHFVIVGRSDTCQ